jgi:kynureninase
VRGAFRLRDGLIYLDGNSLGPVCEPAARAVRRALDEEWAASLIAGWNAHDWIGLPTRLGDRIGRLIGAAPGQVVVCDSISVNLFKLLAFALGLRPGRTRILSTVDNFPTDLYMAQGLQALLGEGRCRLDRVAPESIVDAVDADTAVVMLTQVDFRSGRMLDMRALTRALQAKGALVLWDLAHSAGAVPVDLDGCGADLAVGCGYKYLNGGPGAPAFLYVAARHQAGARQPLSGWMGHARPFAFEAAYRPAAGPAGFLAGTPAILACRALEGALSLWDGIDMAAVRAKSVALTEAFIAEVEASPALASLELLSPRDPALRGSQVALSHPDAHAIVQALIEEDVVGDFREPDVLRFGFTPLYLRHVDVFDAVRRLEAVVGERRHDAERFRVRRAVT